jgi:putative membrane protein
VLDWLFKNFEMITKAALTGFMLGSLNKIWPWKSLLATTEYPNGEIQKIEENILPTEFGGEFWGAIGLAILGFGIIFAIEFISEKMKKNNENVAA